MDSCPLRRRGSRTRQTAKRRPIEPFSWTFSPATFFVRLRRVSLVQLDIELLDQYSISRVIFADQVLEDVGLKNQRLKAAGHVELVGKILADQYGTYGFAQLANHPFRSSGRCKQPEPDVDFKPRVGLPDRRYIREALRPGFAARRQRPQVSSLELTCARCAGEQRLRLACDSGCRGGRPAAVWHMEQIDAGALLEHLHGEMLLAADPARRIGEWRIRRTRIRDE